MGDFLQLFDLCPIFNFAFNIFEYTIVFMLYLKKLDIDLSFEPVGKIVIEGVSQSPVDEFLD